MSTPPAAPADTPILQTRFSRTGALLAIFALIGCALRLRQFLFCRSLWLDEAMLAVSIAARSPMELLRPLEYNQNAPILFLWLSKLSTAILGVNEHALRALPLISGCAAIVALAAAARKAFGDPAAVACASLAALSPALIRYSNEAKPYGIDAFVSSILLLLFVARDATFSKRRAIVFSVAAISAVILSNPSIFTLTAVWIALGWTYRHERPALVRVGKSGLLWVAAFGISYVTVVRPAAANELVRAGYSTAFLPPFADAARLLPLMVSGSFYPAFGGDGTGMPGVTGRQAAIIVSLFLSALIFLGRRHGAGVALVLGGPVTLAFAAAALGLYPVGVPRLMTFHFPGVLLTIAGLVGAAWPRNSSGRLSALGLTLWLLLLWPSWTNAASAWAKPFQGDNFRDAYNEYASLQLGEPVYISAKAQPAWIFYSTNWEPNTRRQRELFQNRMNFYFAAGGAGPSFENRASRGGPIPEAEGRDLVFDFRDRLEILGISTGRQWKWPGYVAPVDAGWPEHEAARVRAAAAVAKRSCEWIIFERISELSYRPLRDSLRFDHGGRRERQLSYPGVTIAQLCHG